LSVYSYTAVNGLLLPLPLSSELLYSRAGTLIETVVLLIEVAMYKVGTLLHRFLEGHHPLRVWYCEVAIYKGWNFTSWFPSQLRLWCWNN